MNGDSGWNCEKRENDSSAGNFFEVTGPANNPELAGEPCREEPFPGFLELVYGVLFEPGKTMKKVAERPPLGLAALVVTIISLLGTLMVLLTVSRVLNQSLQLPGLWALTPLVAILCLLWGYVRWFGYSAILHLAAELLGGQGNARGVFAAVGLAELPSIFMIPVQFLSYWFETGDLVVTVLVGLAGLAVGIWIVILLVVGLKQVHGLSTGRSVFVVFSPLLALMVLVFSIAVTLVVITALIPAIMHFPGYF